MCQQRDNLETYGVLEATKAQRKSMCKKQWSDEEESEDNQKKVFISYRQSLNFIKSIFIT